MRFLVTGAAGGIGHKLCGHLLRLGHDVVGVDDLSCGYAEQVPSGVDLYAVGVEQFCKTYSDLFSRPFDGGVFHLAAYAAECMSSFCRGYNWRNNLLPLASLLNCLIESDEQHGRLVFASSMAVYGDVTDPPFDERVQPRPKDPYGIAKLACEMDLRVAGDQHGIDWCVVRPHNVYGPGQSLWQRYRNVVGLWMRAALEGEELTVFGDGTQQRAFTYVDDVMGPLLQAALDPKASCEVINLGGSSPVSLLDLLVELSTAVDRRLSVTHAPARHEAKLAWCTADKSQRLLGYVDRTTLKDGLRKTWEWARRAWAEHPERRASLSVPRPEAFRGMPEQWRRDFSTQQASDALNASVG